MANNPILTVQAPYGGISRRASYQQHPPFSSYDSLNFWPVDVKTGRITTAVRPPLKLFASLETECNMLAPCAGIATSLPAKSFVAAYGGQIYYWNGSTLVAATGAQAASVDTGKYVSAASVVNQVVICDGTVAPIAFDYVTQAAATIVASAGTVPVAATIAVNHMGALWLVIDSVLYASRVGDITDYDYSAVSSDLYGAFYTDGDYKGTLAGPITAVMPQAADTMMVSTVSGTLAMRGHPRQGGVFEPVGSAYALGQGAWCLLPDDTLLMLTSIGLMSLASSPGAVMAPVSREKIPDELVGVAYDRDDPLVTMKYDTRWNGVHIYIRGAQEQAWWFDMNTGGFHRQEIGSYPFAIMEYEPFMTESTSGILLGRYNGIYTYDRFASETINTSIVMGPVKISPNTMKASKILSTRATFARDTPTGIGTMKIAAGMDGQDAVNRLLNGEHQYEIPLSNLESSYGMCYPDVTGHAAVFAFETSTGDLAIEEVTSEILQMGRLTINRGTQISVTGESTEFNGSYVDLDTDIWAGYSEATPTVAPGDVLPDYTHFIDLSLMPATWWAQVTGPNGEDIRVADANDVQAPCSLIDFNLSGQVGMLAFKMTQQVSPKAVRLWVGNELASTPTVTSEFGQYAAYDSGWRSFWPDGGGASNQTQYGDNLWSYNIKDDVVGDMAAAFGAETGPMGANATEYQAAGGTSYTNWKIAGWHASQGLSSQKIWTLIQVMKRAEAAGINVTCLDMAGGGVNYNLLGAANDGGGLAYSWATTGASTTASAQSDDGGTAIANWRHHAAVHDGIASRSAYIDGGGKQTDTNSKDPTITTVSVPFNAFDWKGLGSMTQIHTVARDDDWIEYQADMLDQVTFWGSIGAFTLVNTAPVDTLDTTACPTGNVAQTEVGNTDGYVEITPVDPSDGSVTKFSALIDLSILPAGWWTAVSTAAVAGVDIRATTTGNVLLPFDLIDIDLSASTGQAVVRMNQAEGGPTAIRIWGGNAAAITINPCNLYGQYTAYDSDWYGFWPSGSGTDRTQYLNDLTAVGAPAVVDSAGPTGGQATAYGNSSGTTQYATTDINLPTGNPVSISASVKKPSGSIHTDSVIASLQDASSKSGVFLHTRPSSTPARLSTRNSFGTEATAGNSTSITATNWWFQTGLSYGNHSRICRVNEIAGSSSSNQDTIILSSLDTFSVGAEYAATPIRGMDASICLLGLHATTRGDAWVSYWDKSLDQATFWDTVGAWVADPTALS